MSTRRPGQEAILGRELRSRLEDAGRSGLSEKTARELLSPEWSARTIRQTLGELERSGDVIEWGRRWIALRHSNFVAGRVQAMTGGDALIRTGERGEVGYFVAHRHLKTARDGDSVLIEPRRVKGRHPKPTQRRRQRLPEAVVVKIIGRRTRLVGRVTCDRGFCRLLPFDPRLRLEVELDKEAREHEGRYVVVRIDETPGGLSSRARGRIEEVLGRLSEPGVDVLVALRHFEIPEEFPKKALEVSEPLPENPQADDWGGREDLRELVTVTIDGETARDFDDAISIETVPGGGYRLGVHIADVSHYVAEGDALDLEAYRRGTSVYFPERAVPMLPEKLSNGLCSLRPGVPRLALSAFLQISGPGRVERRRFAETVIKSHRRLTYEEVRRILEEPDPEDEAMYGKQVLELLRHAKTLMEMRLAAREARGSIDFDLPEGDVILDTDGEMIGIRPGERTVAHRIIEEFMIAANEAVATELHGHEVGAIYRIHEEPDRERILELREVLRPLGLDLKVGPEEVHPSVLQEILKQVEGHAEESFVATLVLHSMKRAFYFPESLGHYALASPHYAHFTSPIRRYPDLLVHRQLRNLMRGRAVEEDVQTLLSERLLAIAEHTSSTERRAERAERLVLQWKVLRHLVGREGEAFTGRITGVKEYGLFVRLVDFYADGLVPIASLTDDYYEYFPERHRLLGQRGGRAFRLADEIQVVLTGVDIHRRMIDLGVSGMPQDENRGRNGRKRSGKGRS